MSDPGIKNHTCIDCGHSTNDKSNFIRHQETHQSNRSFECQVCFKSLKSEEYLTSHIKSFHTNERNHRCVLCDKSFITAKVLNDHMTKVHGDRTKKHPFNLCEKAFRFESHLKEHVKHDWKSFSLKAAKNSGRTWRNLKEPGGTWRNLKEPA